MHYHVTTIYPTGQHPPETTRAERSISRAALAFNSRREDLQRHYATISTLRIRSNGTCSRTGSRC